MVVPASVKLFEISLLRKFSVVSLEQGARHVACNDHAVCFLVLKVFDARSRRSMTGLRLHIRATGLVLTQPEPQPQRQSRRAVM